MLRKLRPTRSISASAASIPRSPTRRKSTRDANIWRPPQLSLSQQEHRSHFIYPNVHTVLDQTRPKHRKSVERGRNKLRERRAETGKRPRPRQIASAGLTDAAVSAYPCSHRDKRVCQVPQHANECQFCPWIHVGRCCPRHQEERGPPKLLRFYYVFEENCNVLLQELAQQRQRKATTDGKGKLDTQEPVHDAESTVFHPFRSAIAFVGVFGIRNQASRVFLLEPLGRSLRVSHRQRRSQRQVLSHTP